MHHVLYMSSASSEPTHHDLVGLLEQARRKNERLGVTGVLVYGDGHFMQLLEGKQAIYFKGCLLVQASATRSARRPSVTV